MNIAEPLDERLRLELEELTTSICRALNDPKRLMILYGLATRPMSVGELCDELELTQSNVSQHLAVLRDRGLVEVQRDGSRAIYTLRHPRVIEAIDVLRDVMTDEVRRRQDVHFGAGTTRSAAR